MGKSMKICFITATLLVFIGLIIFVLAMSAVNWDFSKLSNVKYETNSYEIDEDFSNISIDTKTANVCFILSTDGKCKVTCFEEEKVNHIVTVQENTLVIKVVDKRNISRIFDFSFKTPTITIYLSQAEYESLLVHESTGDVEIPKEFKFKNIDITASTGDVKCNSSSENINIKLNTGNIVVENISAKALDLSTTTGKVSASSIVCEEDIKISVTTGKTTLTDIKCKNLTSNGSTGSIVLNNVIASQILSIQRNTGSVKFDSCDAGEIYMVTSTGSIKGTLLSEKIFIAKSNTGSVDVPKTLSGGKCEVTSNTGSIKIEILAV